jgi:hypothetical protein
LVVLGCGRTVEGKLMDWINHVYEKPAWRKACTYDRALQRDKELFCLVAPMSEGRVCRSHASGRQE